jgi:formate dehydrogenase (coenzyme F420) beta subunit
MVIKFDNSLNTPDALRAFLKRLLDERVVDAILVASLSPHSKLPMPTLVADPEHIEHVVAMAPVAPFNLARMASRVLAKAVAKRVAVVMRPCEVRALIELQKLSQCTLESALVISMDCHGRMENDAYLAISTENNDPERTFLMQADLQEKVCSSCGACLRFVPEHVDLTICLAGQTGNEGLVVEAGSMGGEKVLKKMGGESVMPDPERQAAIDHIMALRKPRREAMTAAAAARMADMALFQQTIANCLNCYSCRTACPVCYCKECVFLTDVFAHRPEILIGRARKRGAVKIPTDTTMFHMTRMAHIAHACVGCGQCSSVCPSHISVADLFITVAEKVQDHYDYVPGEDPLRPWPFLVEATK